MALAVTLTVFSSIITILTIPLFASLAVNHFLGKSAIVSLPIGILTSHLGEIPSSDLS